MIEPSARLSTLEALAYTTISDTLIPGLRNGAVSEAMFWGIFLLCVSLPTAIIAWTEPDPQTLETP